MAYLTILGLFIGLPLVLLFGLAGHNKQILHRRAAWGLLLHVILALVYTTPWDNYLISKGVWWYDEALLVGIKFGWIPLEEYMFFVMQTILTSLWLLALKRFIFSADAATIPRPGLRYGSVALLLLVWIISTIVLILEWKAGTYLAWILLWALPPILLQLAFGADILWTQRRFIFWAIAVPFLYLCFVDSIAIGSGTWTIDPAQSTHILAVGVLPIEEIVFFLVTNVLVVFGMTLILSSTSIARIRSWLLPLNRRKIML
jgi:lycopene cyclase domain-containing protein